MLWTRTCLTILLLSSAATVAGQQTDSDASPESQVLVRTVEIISLSKSKAGDIFPAKLEKPVQVEGQMVRFEHAELILVKAGQGTGEFGLSMHRLFAAGGQKYSVKSSLALLLRPTGARGRGIRTTPLILSKASGNLEVPKGMRLGFNLTQALSLR